MMLRINEIAPNKNLPITIAVKSNIIDISKLIINRTLNVIIRLLLPYYNVFPAIKDPNAIPTKVATFIKVL
jgi:hypothetical protein